MPINLSQASNSDRFVSRHWMLVPIERVTEPPNPPRVPYRAQITVSGVALINLRGNSESAWLRDRVNLDLGVDFGRAVSRAPWPARAGYFWASLRPEQWAGLATINARFNVAVANNDGSAADAFGLANSNNATNWWVDVAVRDTDAWLYRLGYHFTVYGVLTEARIPE